MSINPPGHDDPLEAALDKELIRNAESTIATARAANDPARLAVGMLVLLSRELDALSRRAMSKANEARAALDK